MKKMKKLFAIVLLSLGLLTSVTFGQPLGFEVGVSHDFQNGHFIAPCGCTFADGIGYLSSSYFSRTAAN